MSGKTVVRPAINVVQGGGSYVITEEVDDGTGTGDLITVPRVIVGEQDDGTITTTVHNAPPPPAPTTPVLVAAQLAVVVTWDGNLTAATPADFDHVRIHLSDDAVAGAGFIPDDTNAVGSLRVAGMFPITPLAADVPVWVRLVAVNQAGAAGAPSAAGTATPTAVVPDIGPGTITETEIADDSISTPKLRAGAVEADKIAANTITAGQIAAGAITGAEIAATLLLTAGKQLTVGTAGGQRVDITDAGMSIYSAADVLIAEIAADGSFVFLSSSGTLSLNANDGEFNGDFTVNGDSFLHGDAVDILGDVTLNGGGNLHVTGNATIDGTATADNLFSGIKAGSSGTVTTSSGVGASAGNVTVTHNAGFTPDWVIVNPTLSAILSGPNHWTGYLITNRTATTFNAVCLGTDAASRLSGVQVGFDYLCIKL